ncbi:MAG: addiction module protein [Verrucomicrobia subdivision 3 bacterium]|nr:addiction module protein [Limisphaerales bacterium]
MTALEEIHKLPFHEKLLVMEAIWDDICREEEKLEVPQWHKEILDERERLIAEGKAQFIDWEDAKKQIKEAIG